MNLDGAVNDAAFPFIGEHALERYSRSASVDYIVDDAMTVRSWSPFWRPDSVGIYRDLASIDTVYDFIIARRMKPGD